MKNFILLFFFLSASGLYSLALDWDFPPATLAAGGSYGVFSDVNSSGDAMAIWLDTSLDVYVAYYDGSTRSWSSSEMIDNNGTDGIQPYALVSDQSGAGEVSGIIVYGQSNNLIARIRVGGILTGSWTTALTLNQDAVPTFGEPISSAAMNSSGDATVAWLEDNGTIFIGFVRRFVAADFNEMTPSSGWAPALTDPGYVMHNDGSTATQGIATGINESSDIAVTWYFGGGTSANVEARQWNNAMSKWQPDIGMFENLTTSSGIIGAVRAAIDEGGTLYGMWFQGGSTVTSARMVGGVPITPVDVLGSGNNYQSLAAGPAGSAVAVWDSTGTDASVFSGGSWGASETISSGSTSRPWVDMDQNGDAVAVWDAGSVIRASELTSGVWQPEFDLSSGGTPNAPRVATSINGNAAAIWVGSVSASVGLLPPSPPSSASGRQVANVFAGAIEYFNEITWTFASGENAAIGGYDILVNGVVIGQTSSSVNRIRFHDQVPGESITYEIRSRTAGGLESTGITVTVP